MGPEPHAETSPQPAQSGGGRFRRVVVVLLILLALVVVLAETGVVTAQSSETNWEARSEYETSSQTINRRRVLLGRVNFKPSVTVGVPSSSDRAIATQAANAIHKVPTAAQASPAAVDLGKVYRLRAEPAADAPALSAPHKLS